MTIDGLTEKMVGTLCGKWGYPETVVEEQNVEVPDPDLEAEEGATVFEKQMVSVPNPQSKDDYVKMYVISFITNEYRLVMRDKEKLESEQKAENQVKNEAKLK